MYNECFLKSCAIAPIRIQMMDVAQLTRLFVAWHMYLRQNGRGGAGKLVAAHFILVETEAPSTVCMQTDTDQQQSFIQWENVMYFATDEVIATLGMVVAEADENGELVVVSNNQAPPPA